MARSKKGYIVSYADMFKGVLVGFIIGALVVYFLMTGVIPNPLAPKT